MKVANKPEILLAQAHTKFDEQNQLTDTFTISMIRKKLELLKKICMSDQ